MRVAIMQPYFFPYIGYFSLIKHSDRFILFDPVQFIRHGWIERNRILKQTGGWQYIQVPIIKSDGRDTSIKDIIINNKENWSDRILSQIQHYKKKAPYYWKTVNLLKEIFSNSFNDIVTLNQVSLQTVCDYLGIKRNLEVFSQMGMAIEEVKAPDEWALNICTALGDVSEYVNPIGGESFFDITKYERANISLKFQHMEITPYNQKQEIFEPALSIIDVMMFNPPEEINQMLDRYTFQSL